MVWLNYALLQHYGKLMHKKHYLSVLVTSNVKTGHVKHIGKNFPIRRTDYLTIPPQ